MKAKKSPDKVIDEWLELDLSESAPNGRLPQAFAVEQICEQISDILSSGRNPVVTGESGIGKTAAVYELVRQVTSGKGPKVLEGTRIIQLSFRRRASALNSPQSQMRPEMQNLVDALIAFQGQVVPFIRDIHLAYNYDLEPQLQLLAFQLPCPILAEGDWSGLRELFEETPELEQFYVTVPLEEPNLESAFKILSEWSEAQRIQTGVRFTENAIEEALFLTYRFLARDRLPRKAIDLLLQTGTLAAADKPIERDGILNRFCSHHKIPRFLVDPAIPLDLQQVEEHFQKRVLGQEEAVQAVVQMVGMIKAGLSDIRRPFGAFLFVGPTGVGKTHLAQLLAKYLFASPDRMIRLNMADHQHESDAKLLFGDPDAQSPKSKRGILAQRMTGHPFAVMLLDEFEKAHPKVHDRFLQLIDEGAYFNGAGESVPCRSMIIIATSNTGAEVYRGKIIGFSHFVDFAEMDREVDRRLESQFRFEFLNRFDGVVHFHPLSREHIRRIAQRELGRLQSRTGLRQRSLKLDIDESVLDWVTAHGYDPDHGARFLRRIMEKHVTTALAQAVVRNGTPTDSVLTLTVKRNRIHASLYKEPAAPPTKQKVKLPFGTEERVQVFDAANLHREADSLIKSAERRLKELETKKKEASRLLEQMNDPQFWEDQERKREVLDQYRMLDVSIRIESRLAEPLSKLAEMRQTVQRKNANKRILSETLEQAAMALREWDERLAEDGAGAIWLLISNADPLKEAATFLESLASMELAWCRKLGLTVSVAAYGPLDGELGRVVLEIEGPGASGYLAMEHGLHRLRRTQESDQKSRIELLTRGDSQLPGRTGFRPIRRRKGLFDLEVSLKGTLRLPDRGLSLELVGSDKSTMSQFFDDLERGWQHPIDGEFETARIYGEGGVVRDPRTNVTVARLRDVWRGNLDGFLEGWRRERGATE